VLLSFAAVWIIALFHLRNLKLGSAFQNFSTVLKLLLIGAIIGAGVFHFATPELSFLPTRSDIAPIFATPFAVGLVYVMYSYSGWNASAYIISEVRQPERNVPRSLLCGTLVVIAIYTALNAIFLLTTPATELSGQLEVALIAGKHIFGDNGGRIVGAIICVGLISSISSMTWIGPRVTMVMGEDATRLRFLARKKRDEIPANAILLQLLIVNILLLTRSFELVVVYIQFSLLLCSLLTVIGVIVLRWNCPALARPYKVWAYPLPPLIFAAITVWMMCFLLRSHPVESFAGLFTMLAGLLLYFVSGTKRQSADAIHAISSTR
jgi:APA family basic amino acid/polyamine antiporter